MSLPWLVLLAACGAWRVTEIDPACPLDVNDLIYVEEDGADGATVSFDVVGPELSCWAPEGSLLCSGAMLTTLEAFDGADARVTTEIRLDAELGFGRIKGELTFETRCEGQDCPGLDLVDCGRGAEFVAVH
jgi:hypothetical protein